MSYACYFVAGLLIASGMPHFVKGLAGELHDTPFRRSGSALLNVVWGIANFFFAGWFLIFASLLVHGLAYALVAFTLGLLAAGVWTARGSRRREGAAAYV